MALRTTVPKSGGVITYNDLIQETSMLQVGGQVLLNPGDECRGFFRVVRTVAQGTDGAWALVALAEVFPGTRLGPANCLELDFNNYDADCAISNNPPDLCVALSIVSGATKKPAAAIRVTSTAPAGRWQEAALFANWSTFGVRIVQDAAAPAVTGPALYLVPSSDSVYPMFMLRNAADNAEVLSILQNGNFQMRSAIQFGPMGVLNSQVSAAGLGNGADATDDTLFTYNLPANALSANGKSLRVLWGGRFAANGNVKVVKVWFAGTSITVFNGAINGESFQIVLDVTRLDATDVLCTLSAVRAGGSTAQAVTSMVVADLAANASIIKITGASGASAANDVLGYLMRTEVLN